MAPRSNLARIVGLGARSHRKSRKLVNRWRQLEQLERRELLATITWSGAVDRNWDTAGNWVGGAVPGAADVARFTDSGAGNVELGGATHTVGGVQFENSGIGATVLQEQFETDGTGTRYTVLGAGGNAASAATEFWKRTADAPTHTGLAAYTGASGEFWIESNQRGTWAGGPFTATSTRNVTLNPVDVTGQQGVQITVSLAAAQAFEDDNHVAIFADPDGPGPAPYQLLTRFQGTATPNNVFPCQVGNTSNCLSLAFKDVTVNAPAGSTQLQIKIEGDGNSTAEQFAFDNIRVTSSPANYTLNGGTLDIVNSLLQLGAGTNIVNSNVTTGLGFTGTVSSGNLTFNGSVTLPTTGDATISPIGTTVTINGPVLGAGGLAKSGTGTLVLTNNTSTYSGVTSITAGTLQATASNALGATSGGTVVSNGAQLTLTTGMTIAEPLTLNGTGIGGTGALRTSGGNFSYNSPGVITLGSNAEIQNEAGNTLTINSGVNTNGFVATLDAVGPFTIAGTGISGTGGFNKINTAALNLNVASSQTGTSTINGGTVVLGADNALGAGTVVLQSGTIRSSNTTARSNAAPLQLAGNMTFGDVTNSGVLLFTGPAVLTGNRTITTVSNVELQGVLDDGAGAFGFTKAGAGNLTLSGNNTFEGTTIVSTGTLIVAHPNALGAVSGGTSISSTGRLGLSGGIVTAAEPITVFGTGVIDNVAGNNTLSGNVILAGGVLAQLDFGATGQRVEPGFTAVGVANGDGVNLPATPLSFGPVNYTIAMDNLDETGAVPTNSRLDWRDRADVSPLEPLVEVGEDQAKNIGGVIHVTLAGLPAGTYNATAYHIDAEVKVHSNLIRVFEKNGGAYTLVSPPGKTGDGSASTTALTQAIVDASKSTFTFTSNGINNVELVFNGIGAPNGVTEIDLNGLVLDLTSPVGSLDLNAASGTTLTMPGIIAGGALAVNKTGSGTVNLQGANTYGGTTTISAGTLIAANSAALGSSAGGTTIGNTGTLAFDGDLTIADNLTAAGNATIATLTGTTTLSGTVTASAAPIPGAIYAQLDLGVAGQLVEPGFLGVDGPAAGNFTTTLTSATADSFTLTVDNIDQTGAAVGTTLDWRNRGTVASASPLVQLGEDHVKNDGGVVRLSFASLPAGIYSATAWHYNAEPATGTMPVVVRVDNGTGGYQVVTPPGRIGVKDSTLGAAALTTAAVDATRSTFLFTADGTNDVHVVFDGRPIPGDELPVNGIALQQVTLSGSLTFNTAANSALVLTQGINDGTDSIAVTKTGAGALILNGASTYDGGTTVNGGVLSVNNATGSATGSGAVDMNAGSILLGTGTIAGNVNMNPGSLVSPGGGYQNGAFDDPPLNAFGFPTSLAVPTGAPIFGTLTINGNLNLAANSISTSDIRTGGSDMVVVGGTVTIADDQAIGTGEIENGLTPPGTVTFLSNTGAGTVTGEFAQLDNNSTFDFDGFNARINYDGGPGNNDVVITFLLNNGAPVNSVPGLPAGIATTNYTALVKTVTGPVFGTTVPLNTPVSGFFTYNTATADALPGDPNRGNYPHTSGGAFLASFLGINLTGSATPFVQVEDFTPPVSDTFRYNDGDTQGGTMSVNGVANANARVNITFTDTSGNAFTTDALIAPLPFGMPPLNSNLPSSFPHTFSINDGPNSILLQLVSATSVAGSVTVNEDDVLAFTGANAITVSDPDAGTDAIRTTVAVPAAAGTLNATAAPGATITGSGNSLQIDGPQAAINATLATLTFTPTANFNGQVGMTVTTDDLGNTGTGGAQVDTDTVTITVVPVNDEPSFTIAGNPPTAGFNSGLNTVPNFAANMSKGPADEATQALTFNLVVGTTTGGLTFSTPPAINPATGALTYAATTGTSGTAQITVTLVDNGSNVAPNDNTSASQTFTITVSSIIVNQPPTISAPATAAINEDTSLAFTGANAVSIADADAGTANVSTTVSIPAGRGTLAVSAAVVPGLSVSGNNSNSITLTGPQAAINAKLATLSYAPVANANATTIGGPVVLTVAVNDNGNTGQDGAKTASSTVNITITPVNDAPILGTINDPPSSLTGSGVQTISGFASATTGPASATDEAPPAQTIVAFNTTIQNTTGGLTFITPPAISPSGTLTYQATPGSKGTATIRVVAQDSGSGVAPNVNLSAFKDFVINVVGTAPSIEGPDSTVRNAPTTFTFESLNPLAADGDPITFNVDWDGDGEVDETFDGEFQGGTATVTVVHQFPIETPPDEPNEVVVFTTDATGDSETTSHFIDVKIFDLVTNPDTGEDDLVFGGTFDADRIVVSLLSNGGIQIRDNADVFKIPGTLGNVTGKLVIWGGEGGDSINISPNVPYDTELHGQDGNDYIAGGKYNDILDGGAGNDRLVDSFGNNTYIGGDGVDILSGGRGNDELFGGAGRDSLTGSIGNDIMDGGEGNDTIVGFDGNDIMFGGPGNDTMRGDRGADIILGGDQNDNIQGGPGRDILVGGNGADQIYGGTDDDLIVSDDLDLGNGGDFALDVETLRLLMTDWLKPIPLKGTSSNTRSNLLSDRLNESTIIEDGSRDTLFGQTEADWFLTYSFDQVKDLRPEDLKTVLDA